MGKRELSIKNCRPTVCRNELETNTLNFIISTFSLENMEIEDGNLIELLDKYFVESEEDKIILMSKETKEVIEVAINYRRRRLICYICSFLLLRLSVSFLFVLVLKE